MEIAATGPMSVARYMQLCLQHPEHGYYTRQDPLGATGDFTTAPEISQMFGEMLGLWAATVWQAQGLGAVNLVELGPGRGTLMADVLRTAHAVPGFVEAITPVFVETSPALRARQRDAITRDALWCDCIEDAPQGPAILLANEFFDALPARQFQREGQGWAERLVAVQNDALALGLAPAAPSAKLDGLFGAPPDGTIVELRATDSIMAEIAARVSEGGATLILDYGDWNGAGDTLQALEQHTSVDPLASPGTADLTTHVNFSHLAAGMSLRTQFDSQGAVLERLGITARAQTLARQPGQEDAIATQHRRLTHPSEMGTLFKALTLSPPGAPLPPGFLEAP